MNNTNNTTTVDLNNRININVDSYNSIENALMQNLIAQYDFPIEGLTTNTELYVDLLEDLKDVTNSKEIKEGNFNVKFI